MSSSLNNVDQDLYSLMRGYDFRILLSFLYIKNDDVSMRVGEASIDLEDKSADGIISLSSATLRCLCRISLVSKITNERRKTD